MSSDSHRRELERVVRQEGPSPANVARLARAYQRCGEAMPEIPSSATDELTHLYVVLEMEYPSTRANRRLLESEPRRVALSEHEALLAAAILAHDRIHDYPGFSPTLLDRDIREQILAGRLRDALDIAHAARPTTEWRVVSVPFSSHRRLMEDLAHLRDLES